MYIDIMRKYILIHGDGTNKDAQENMEIFNALVGDYDSGLITNSLPWNIDKLNVFSYSWTLMDDLFVITGGIEIESGVASNSIQYLNVSKIFTIPPNNESFVWEIHEYPCITKYNTSGQWFDLDDYLLQKRSIRFQVNTHEYEIKVNGNANGASIPSEFTLEAMGMLGPYLQFGIHALTRNTFGQNRLFWSFPPLNDVSKSTNIDMTNKSVLWMRWDDQYW